MLGVAFIEQLVGRSLRCATCVHARSLDNSWVPAEH